MFTSEDNIALFPCSERNIEFVEHHDLANEMAVFADQKLWYIAILFTYVVAPLSHYFND